jgi:hypothetical protein
MVKNKGIRLNFIRVYIPFYEGLVLDNKVFPASGKHSPLKPDRSPRIAMPLAKTCQVYKISKVLKRIIKTLAKSSPLHF